MQEIFALCFGKMRVLCHSVRVEFSWLIALVAFSVGLLVGVTGVGAGALMTPILVGFFGVSLPVAIATDLIFATLTKLVAVPFHHRNGSVNWGLTKKLWWGSIPGTVVGVGIVVFVVSKEQTSWLLWPLVAIVAVTAVTLGRRALNPDQIPVAGNKSGLSPAVAPLGGFGIGSAVALTSVGAGALGMALLVRLAPPGVKPSELVGTDIAHAIPIALIAGIAYSASGLVSISLLATLLLGSLPGVVAGSLLAGRVSPRFLNGGLSLVLALAAVLVVARAL